MNLGDIHLRVQRLFGDESQAQITPADITAWANDGQLRIARLTEELTEIVELDPIEGQGGYDIPFDFIREDRLLYKGTVLTKMNWQQADGAYPFREVENTASVGTPSSYYMYGKKIFVYPYPSVTETDTLDLWYIRTPHALEASDQTPEVSVTHHEDIVRYCLMRAKELNEDDSRANELSAQFDADILLAVDEIRHPNRNSYPAVRDISYESEWGLTL